jgi:lactose/L-arabinose transport system ATP-binding protein
MAAVRLRGVRKAFGRVETIRGVDLDIADREFCVFVGPSGCGKSTLLRLIAGLEDITDGDLFIGDRRVNALPPARRGVAMVFQSYALYPHMTAYDNMAFGLTLAKAGRGAIDAAVRRAAAILELTPLLERLPRELSGGQRQRVAIGRAIVRDPEVFLFDEPLSNLDAALRVQTRIEIAKLHREMAATMIYVTHDQVEAMTLADKIVVLRDGRVEQSGPPLDLYRDPANRFVASFIGSPGMNFVGGVVAGGAVRAPGLSAAPLRVAASLPAEGKPVTLGLRPQQIAIDPAGDTHRVEFTEALGGVSYVYAVAASGERVIVEARDERPPPEGARVGLTFRPDHVLAFDPETEARLR